MPPLSSSASTTSEGSATTLSTATVSVMASSTSGTRKRHRRLRIDVAASAVRTVPSWRDMSSARIRAIWYQDRDYDDMAYDNDRVLQRMIQGERFRPDDNRHCGRGLENQLPERNEKRQQHKRSVVKTVLLEQTIRRRELDRTARRRNKSNKSGGTDANGRACVDGDAPYRSERRFTEEDDRILHAVAAVARKATRRACEYAHAMGKQDAKIVQTMWKKDSGPKNRAPFTRTAPGRTVSAMARSKKTVAAQECAALAVMEQTAKHTRGQGTSDVRSGAKKVRFAPRVAARKVLHLNDMPESMQCAIWFQPKDIKRMKADRKRSLQHVLDTPGDARDDYERGICIRGTECIREKDLRKQYKTRVLKAVLVEQERQKQTGNSNRNPSARAIVPIPEGQANEQSSAPKTSPEGVCDNSRDSPDSDDESDDDLDDRLERIRQASLAVSDTLARQAVTTGQADERAVYGHNKSTSKKALRPQMPSPLRSSRRLLDGLKADDGGSRKKEPKKNSEEQTSATKDDAPPRRKAPLRTRSDTSALRKMKTSTPTKRKGRRPLRKSSDDGFSVASSSSSSQASTRSSEQ